MCDSFTEDILNPGCEIACVQFVNTMMHRGLRSPFAKQDIIASLRACIFGP